ncbi:uncharacterized protein G2W53_012682 [Senna tora]|uniref:Uncharacterized protein n=1 Tax=Senna tora TaxID=362788 RepID=A0A834TYG9_9FABA|nr:uncharacterized protein G2W53_012682 [Senna tora]
MLKVILSVDFSLKTKMDGILCALKDALTDHERNSSLIFVISSYKRKDSKEHRLCTLYDIKRHVGGCCLLKSTSTLNLVVLVSCTLLAGGSSSLCLLDQLMSASGMAALHSNAKSSPARCLTRSKYIMCMIDVLQGKASLISIAGTVVKSPCQQPLDVHELYQVFLGHTLSLCWRSSGDLWHLFLALDEPSLLTSTTKFSICGGGILCLQQVGASRNIPSKALLGSSRSIEGSWFFFGFFVSAATTSLGACWFLMMLSRRVEEMTSWLLATSSSVTACPS